MSIEGPAAVDIVATFVERWNEPACDLTYMKPHTQPPPPAIDHPAAVRSIGKAGFAAVQLLRTYSCAYARGSGCLSTFAPRGETSVSDGILKATRTARHFIYIEDQYFYWFEPLYDALRDALRNRIAHLILLVQWPQEIPGSSTWVWRFWYPLRQEFPDKVHAFYRKGGVYIHSKTKVFDDVLVMSGSANVNYRSHTSDAEAVASVVDEGQAISTPEGFQVNAWARGFRCQLFEDNTGVPAQVWQNLSIDDAVKRWHAVAEKQDSRIGSFQFDWSNPDAENIPNYEKWSDVDAIRLAADTDDRCSDDLHSGHFPVVI